MKKLTLISIILAFTLSVNAQNSLPNKYQINTDGVLTTGISIPSGFVVEFKTVFIKDIDSAGWNIEIDAATYSDTSCTVRIKNYDIANNLKFTIPATYADSTNKSIFINMGVGKLNEVYGEENVINLD